MPKIAYSVELKRPGCVLLQAAMGCDPAVAHGFPSETWIIGEGMETLRVYNATEEELKKLVLITEAAYERKKNERPPTRREASRSS